MARTTDDYQMSTALDTIFNGIKTDLTNLLGYDKHNATLSDNPVPVETPTKTQIYESYKNKEYDEGLKSIKQRARQLIKATTYTELKAVITTQDTQFAKLKKIFAISSDVLNHTLPELFEIIDTVSVKNIIYDKTDLVNTLLNNVLFSELTKIDNNLKKLYNKVDHDQSDRYKSIRIEYLNSHKYRVTYPDFLADAFETIINKLRKNDDFNNILTIKAMTPEEEHTERITLQTTSTTLMMIATAAATAAAMEKATAEDKAKLIKESDAIADLKARIAEAMYSTSDNSKYVFGSSTKLSDAENEFIISEVGSRRSVALAKMNKLATQWAAIIEAGIDEYIEETSEPKSSTFDSSHPYTPDDVAKLSSENDELRTTLSSLLSSIDKNDTAITEKLDRMNLDSEAANTELLKLKNDQQIISNKLRKSAAKLHRGWWCGLGYCLQTGGGDDLKEFNEYRRAKDAEVYAELVEDDLDGYPEYFSQIMDMVLTEISKTLKNGSISDSEDKVVSNFRNHWEGEVNRRRQEMMSKSRSLVCQIALMIEVANAGLDIVTDDEKKSIGILKITNIHRSLWMAWVELANTSATDAKEAMRWYILHLFILHESMTSIIEKCVTIMFNGNKHSL
jgi:hypothetical protein